MKSIDFTQPGGFPLTQDQLGYMQTAWQEVVNALLSVGVCNGAPTILTGMQIGTTSLGGPGGGYVIGTVSAGWFIYEGVAVRFPAQTFPLVSSPGEALYIVINSTAAPLIYNSGTHNAILDATGALQTLPTSTPVDSTHFLFYSLAPFGKEAAFTTDAIYVTGPGSAVTSGSFSYRKNSLTNTLEGVINFSVTNPSSLSAVPYFTFVTVATLPSGYRPLHGGVYFTGSTTGLVSYGSGSGYFNTLSGFVNTDGTVNLVLMNSPSSSYSGNINFIISLD